MRILIVHNRYQQRGGEDTVVDVEASNLRGAGHDVQTWTVDNDSISGVVAKARAALQTADSTQMRQAFDRVAAEFSPDVVHFHNIFPRLTPGVVAQSLANGLPTFLTLHNFRFICVGAMLMREGKICEECVGGSRLPGIRHGCYRGSVLGSAATARMGQAFKKLCRENPRLKLIALTRFARSRFIADGFPEDQILVKPNTVEDCGIGNDVRDRSVLFVGRCSPEKGVDLLMRIAPALAESNIGIDVIGDGPLLASIRAAGVPDNVRLLGHLARAEVIAHIKQAAAVVMPSRWYEGFPMVLLEAFSTATPVIASHLGSLAELVISGETGWSLTPDHDAEWIDAIKAACDRPAETTRLGRNARALYDQSFGMARNVAIMEQIYASVPKQPHSSTAT